jgi:hypothetical protein
MTSKTARGEIYITLARIPYGVAGGLTEHERRQLRRGRRSTSNTAASVVDEVLVDGPPSGMTASERAGVGRMLLAAGRSTRQVAGDCGVCTRTVQRWATSSTFGTGALRTGTSSARSAGEGSRGGNRAPLRISTAHHALAGSSAPEGV